MKLFLFFLLDFTVVFILYFLVYVAWARREKKAPPEAQFLINLYNLDTKKFNYKKFMFYVSLVSSFDVALVVLLVTNISGLIWQLLFGFIIVVPVAIFSFMMLGKYYSKKQNKDNSRELEIERAYLEKMDNKKKRKTAKKSEDNKETKTNKKTTTKTKEVKKGQKKNVK